MMRLLEIVVALILVVLLAVVVGLLLPSHGHVERSLDISHNLGQTYDTLDNFRRFDDYSAVRSLDPNAKFTLSGPAFGDGAQVAWEGQAKMGDGSLEIAGSEKDQQIIWKLDNAWRGTNKHFTIQLQPTDNRKLIKIVMSYDVDYGWNLIDRYSQLYLHGHPSTFMQYTLASLQSLLAAVPNIDYTGMEPVLVDTPEQAMLLVSTEARRSLDDIAVATQKAYAKILAVMAAKGIDQVGPYVILTTNWGDQSYSFDVGVPIGTSRIKFDERVVDLHDAPQSNGLSSAPAAAASADTAAASSAPTEGPGSFGSDGTLTITPDVSATLVPKGRALMVALHGGPVQLPYLRLGLKAYAATHGYDFNEFAYRPYDIDVSASDNETVDERDYRVYLPVSSSPAATPWQLAHPEEAAAIIDGPSTAKAADDATDEVAEPGPDEGGQ